MSEREPWPESEPASQEIEASRRLAQALETGDSSLADGEAVAAAFLLQSGAHLPPDDVGRQRLRKELVAAVVSPTLGLMRWVGLAAASLVAGALLVTALWRMTSAPSLYTLEAREMAARQALESVPRSTRAGLSTGTRMESTYDTAWRERLDSELQSSRFTRMWDQSNPGNTASGGRSRHAIQNSGGAS